MPHYDSAMSIRPVAPRTPVRQRLAYGGRSLDERVVPDHTFLTRSEVVVVASNGLVEPSNPERVREAVPRAAAVDQGVAACTADGDRANPSLQQSIAP